MASFIHTADLHLTRRKEDEYRWEIFPWIAKRAAGYQADGIFVHGDLTEVKDEHSAELVNRLVESLQSWAEIAPVYVLKGNHDYDEDEAQPFFRFIRGFKNIRYFSKPAERTVEGLRCLFLPHARSWRAMYDKLDLSPYDRVFLHQAVEGARQPSGYRLEGGVLRHRFKFCKPDALVIAGDIHMPQQAGRVIYCGSPHPVDFGDEFEPRVLLERDGQLTSLPRKTIRKAILAIRDPLEVTKQGFTSGDRVKLTVELHRSEFASWPDVKKTVMVYAEALGLEVIGPTVREIGSKADTDDQAVEVVLSPGETLKQFCTAKKVDPRIMAEGLRLLDSM